MNSLRAASGFCVVLCVLLVGLVGCSERPKLARLPSDAVVLAFGDSLTYGTGAAEEESYPAQLERLIGRRVVRAGIPGEVTAQAVKRLPQLIDEHSPRLVLLCIGGNDFIRRLDSAQAEAKVRAMVALARERGIEVLLIGTPQPGLSVSAPAFFAAIAEEFRLPYEADVIAEVLTDNRLKSDLIHPNARGYRVIAERVAERLKQSGAI
jgi:lysophospholipase L1-like esterase